MSSKQSNVVVRDARHEIDMAVNKMAARIEQLTEHLDWIGWSSEGIAAAKQENRELRSALTTALRQWEAYYGEHNSKDIGDSSDSESCAYRACKSALKGGAE